MLQIHHYIQETVDVDLYSKTKHLNSYDERNGMDIQEVKEYEIYTVNPIDMVYIT